MSEDRCQRTDVRKLSSVLCSLTSVLCPDIWHPRPRAPTVTLMTYQAPVSDIAFALKHSAGFSTALGEGLFGDLGQDTVEAVLAEAGKFATDVIAPLNAVGDRTG